MKWLFSFIRNLADQKFYGALIINFNDGRIVHVKKEESVPVPKA